jgi:hypothetical protein
MRVRQLVDGSTGQVTVKGAPLDPALGLPRVVIYEKRWVQEIQLLLGLGTFAMGLYYWAQALGGNLYDGKYGPLVYLLAPIGPAIMWDAWRKLRRWTCLVIAEYGFDDRMGDKPAGPVLWGEVASMSRGTSMHVSSHGVAGAPTLNVILRRGPRQPLSPLGAPPKQIGSLQLELATGPERRIPELMEQAFARWQQDQQLYRGF